MEGLTPDTTYDLHGIAGIALHDANANDAAIVDRQLGPIRGPLPAAPRVDIVFVDRFPRGPMSLIGLRQTGFDDDRFYVLRSSHKVPARTAIDLGGLTAGAGTTIVVERGAPSVPLLIPILNLLAIGVGALPLHAAAVRHRGVGVLVTGWSKGGKTETLMAFMRHGAEYVGDEWVYLTDDGRMHGIPEPIRLWGWHLKQLPDVRGRVPLRQRGRLGALSVARRTMRIAAAGRARPIDRFLAGQDHVDVAPHALFGTAARQSATLDAICLVSSSGDPRVTLREIEASEVARRMVHSLAFERSGLMSAYMQFRYAFPDRRSTLIEHANDLEADLLEARFVGRRAVALQHPYPVEIDALFRALAPTLG